MSKLKTITKKTTPATFDERVDKLKQVHRGWLGYYRMASIQGKLKELDGTLERLRKRGYEAMLEHYTKIAPHLNEPLYTRTVRTVV